MKRSVTIIGSSAAVTEPWADLFLSGLETEMYNFQARDPNFALSVSGELWQVVASRFRQEQEAVTRNESSVVDPESRRKKAIELLRSWREGDQEEQRATLDFIMTAIDGNRIAGSKMFNSK